MDNEALRNLQRLRDDLLVYAPNALKIRDKAGDMIAFEFNNAQRQVHALLEKQREEVGYVRAIILKGRQMGISTYIAARFYHQTTMRRGVHTYIMCHEQSASDNLFGMVDRYHRHAGHFAPHVGASNAKELEFDKLDSNYKVATAGSKAGGRSQSLTLMHWSETAFSPNAKEHFASSVQAVPLAPGTEIILESTSAGPSGEFYEHAMDAMNGKSDYQLIFLPWFTEPLYRREVDDSFVLRDEPPAEGEFSEVEYMEHFGLDMQQMCWRRHKIQELRDPMLFKREYPASIDEAWTAPGDLEPFIKPMYAMRARKAKRDAIGPLIVGVDPASGGGDRFAMSGRRGLSVEWTRYRNKIDHETAVAWIVNMIDTDKPERVNIDAGNIGSNIVTSLKNLGGVYAQVVRGVNFGGPSQWRLATPKRPGPHNRRAEMWGRVRDWLSLPEGVSIPDDPALQADLCAPMQKPRLDNWWLLEAKKDMKARGVRSPDLGDSVALTFASNEILKNHNPAQHKQSIGGIDVEQRQPIRPSSYTAGGQTSWMA